MNNEHNMPHEPILDCLRAALIGRVLTYESDGIPRRFTIGSVWRVLFPDDEYGLTAADGTIPENTDPGEAVLFLPLAALAMLAETGQCRLDNGTTYTIAART